MHDDIVAFCCEHSAYTAADIAGSEGLHYSSKVRIIRVPCAGRVDALHMLRAFESGCAAVLVMGCESGACHHIDGNERAEKRIEYAKALLAEVGIDGQKVAMFNLAPNAPRKFVKIIEDVERSVYAAGGQR